MENEVNPLVEKNVEHVENIITPVVKDILLNKNVIEFFINILSKIHLGDDWVKILLLLASFSPFVLDKDEYIHVTIQGNTGRGKSSVVQAFLACLPGGAYLYWSGCSEKYVLYFCKDNPKALENKILYVDDDVLIQSYFIRSIKTPNKQGLVHYGTVIDKEAIQLVIEGCPVVFESRVHSHHDPQDRSRSLVATVDESEEHQKKVRDFIIDKECGDGKLQNGSVEFNICQKVIQQLRNIGWKQVEIPKRLSEKTPKDVDTRQLKRFFGLIKCSCFINQFKREHRGNVIIANEEDVDIAISIYSHFLKSEIYGLSTTDEDIIKYFSSQDKGDYDDIAKSVEKSRETVFNHVRELAERGYISTRRDDRKDIVSLTEKGQNILIFLLGETNGLDAMMEKNRIKINLDNE